MNIILNYLFLYRVLRVVSCCFSTACPALHTIVECQIVISLNRSELKSSDKLVICRQSVEVETEGIVQWKALHEINCKDTLSFQKVLWIVKCYYRCIIGQNRINMQRTFTCQNRIVRHFLEHMHVSLIQLGSPKCG